uniref:Ubiquitin carboxyl-terminal hydrolase MINDY n=1 Tax=Hippocampus comes TaxID=109280 RepID=A0A3Q2YCT5_HIPCM
AMVICVEEVSASLVREYLSRKGLKRTIACMDEEHPRTQSSINNRSHLRQVLHIEDLYRANKVKTFNICLTAYMAHLRTSSTCYILPQDKGASPNARVLLSLDGERFMKHSETGSWLNAPADENGQSKMASRHDNNRLTMSESEKKPPVNEVIQRSRPSRIRRGMMAGPIASTLQVAFTYSTVVCFSNRDTLIMIVCYCCDSGVNQTKADSKSGHASTAAQKTRGAQEVSGWTVREILQNVHRKHCNCSEQPHSPPNGPAHRLGCSFTPGDFQIKVGAILFSDCFCSTQELKSVLLGSSLKCFTVEWRNQGFTFSETHDLRYGMVQKKGGPCGVLASIQAFVLKKLLFENMDSSNTRLQPTNATRRKCLVLAVAEVLWRASEEKQATVAINSGRMLFTPSGHYTSEGVLEKISCFTVDSIEDLQLLLEQNIEQFETGELGCLLLTISAVLSRSIDKLKEDMDVATTALIGAHGYCTQELVNLLLVGRAVSNAFDGDVELDSGNGNSTLLKGIKAPCNIGLLSLFEHYNIFKVGDYLKNPLLPIWVVCSESHFSVLFGLQEELLTNQDKGEEFDLYYYDGLANQQEEIRLTVSVGKSALSCQDADLIPPLELCIRTR